MRYVVVVTVNGELGDVLAAADGQELDEIVEALVEEVGPQSLAVQLADPAVYNAAAVDAQRRPEPVAVGV